MISLYSVRLQNRMVPITEGLILQRLQGTKWVDLVTITSRSRASQAVEQVKHSSSFRIIRRVGEKSHNVFCQSQWLAIRKLDCRLAVDTHREEWKINRSRVSSPANDREMIAKSIEK